MAPITFLWLMVLLSVTGLTLQFASTVRRHRAIRALASELGLHFCASDRFRLASRVAERFPVSGAANVRVFDLLYGLSGGRYHYIFTCEYTVGVIRTKHRHARVMSASEPRERCRTAGDLELHMGAADANWVGQYRLLAAEASRPPTPASSGQSAA